MNTRKISTWIFCIILIVVFMFAIVMSISSVKHMISLDNSTELLNEEHSNTDNELIDSNLYEPIEPPVVSDDNNQMPEQLLEDVATYPTYTIDVVNFEILLNDKRIDYSNLEEIYDGLKLHFGGKLKQDRILYIDEESILIKDDKVSFTLIDVNTRKVFDSVTLKY